MTGISFRLHFGWKPIPRKPIPISSATAFTCRNWGSSKTRMRHTKHLESLAKDINEGTSILPDKGEN